AEPRGARPGRRPCVKQYGAAAVLSEVGGRDPAVHRWQLSQPFDGSPASRVNPPVRGNIVDLAARGADIHQFPVAQTEQGGAQFLSFAALLKRIPPFP